ncbi:hypothetical protein S40293_02933 [Stachybotrys chartarum IBT 40293]|nr:hypothetical protein S40293_02933 [Stachybotrys chartarum IBT 40293]
MIKTLGSRRALSQTTAILHADKPELATTFPKNTRSSSERARKTRRLSALSINFDAMASALLDESSGHADADDTSGYQHKDPSPARLCTMKSDCALHGFLTTPRQSTITTQGADGEPAAQEIPTAPLPSYFPPRLTRAMTTKEPKQSSGRWNLGDSARRVSQSEPLSGGFRSGGLKQSCSVPFPQTLRTQANDIDGQRQAWQGLNVGEEIQQKVTAMLAATETLKPTRAAFNMGSTSRKPRTVGSKVFEKMSNV